jgi:sarcosine oxidase subunit gamma
VTAEDRDGTARSPLVGLIVDLERAAMSSGGAVTFDHVPFLAQVDVRANPRLAPRAPYPLPLTPNTAWESRDRAALWLGPDEWLVLGPPGAEHDIVEELGTAFAGEHHSVVDVTSNRVAIEIAGSAAKDVLAMGCSLDLSGGRWVVGSCAQTLLADTQVILHERASSTGILVRPSFAEHLVDWLIDAVDGVRRAPA